MQYSTNPYRTWKPVEAQTGNLFFPDQQSVQNPPPNFPPQGQKPSGKEPVRWSQRFHPKTQSDYYQEDYSNVKTFSYNQLPFGVKSTQVAAKSTQQTRENQDYNQKTENNRIKEVDIVVDIVVYHENIEEF